MQASYLGTQVSVITIVCRAVMFDFGKSGQGRGYRPSLGRNFFLSATFLCFENSIQHISRRSTERSLATNTTALQAKRFSASFTSVMDNLIICHAR